VRDVLDQLLAQIFKDHAAAMKQVIVHSSRDADLPALYQPLEPGGDVHAVAEDVALFDHDVADVDANSEAHLSPFRLTFIGSCKRLLDLDCAVNRVEYAREFGKYAIAGGVRDPTSMASDKLVDYSATGGQRRDRRFFIAVHQSAVALDIRGEDCSETSLERRSLHSGLTFGNCRLPSSNGSGRSDFARVYPALAELKA
jgi:hypothetical protein